MKRLAAYLIFALLAASIFTGCKPDEIIITQTEVQRITDTLHQYSVLHDSIYFRDSIFIERNVLPAATDSNTTARDTLRETKFVYRYLYKEKKGKDSVRVINRTDTILIKEPDLTAIKAAEQRAEIAQQKKLQWKGLFYVLLVSAVSTAIYFIYQKLKP